MPLPARRIDTKQIADVLQLPDLLADPKESASPAMARLAVQQACAALAQSDWRTLWNRKRTALHAGALLLGIMVPVVFALTTPFVARLSVARWLLGSSPIGRRSIAARAWGGGGADHGVGLD